MLVEEEDVLLEILGREYVYVLCGAPGGALHLCRSRQNNPSAQSEKAKAAEPVASDEEKELTSIASCSTRTGSEQGREVVHHCCSVCAIRAICV